jgi:hypothetical protein
VYFLGEEVAKRIGDTGSKVLLSVFVIVATGLTPEPYRVP